MRMRRKSRLDERIEGCDKHLLFSEFKGFYSKDEQEKYTLTDYRKVFGNENPVWLDLGCGKGGFALETAKLNPEINIIGVEKISNVIIEGLERAMVENPENCAFLNCGIENLRYHIPENSVSRIFLNFSCPYPKNTYKNRRLTYYRYLELYKKLLTKGGDIRLKTDNADFFTYSLQSFSENGFKLRNISLCYKRGDEKDDVETEYEKLFRSKGMNIYRVEAYIGATHSEKDNNKKGL